VDVTLRRGLCDALAEVLSLEIEPPEIPPAPGGEASPLIDFLTEHLELNCVQIAHDNVERKPLINPIWW
jgi:hypothetical protein